MTDRYLQRMNNKLRNNDSKTQYVINKHKGNKRNRKYKY